MSIVRSSHYSARGVHSANISILILPHRLYILSSNSVTVAANVKYHSLQPESGRSGLLLDIAFYGRCDPQSGVPGKILEKDMQGGQVSITPPLFLVLSPSNIIIRVLGRTF